MSLYFKAFWVFFWLMASSSWATGMPGLYETEVIAASSSEEDKTAAVSSALAQVLSRVMAGGEVLQDATVRQMLVRAPQYVKQSQFSLGAVSMAGNQNARLLRVLFDQTAVLETLAASALRVWDEDRPETLLWLVVEEEGQRGFFRSDTMYDISNAITQSSRQTGLPVLLPLQDLDEQRQISVNDVLSAYPQRLLSISERYNAMSILAGRVVKRDNCWQAHWSHYFDNQVVQAETPCQALNDVVLAGLQQVYARMSIYYAVKPVGIETASVTLAVSQIDDAEDKNRVITYLKTLPMVTAVERQYGDARTQRYRVSFNGDRAAFEDMLGLGRVLNPQGHQSRGSNELHYQLLPAYL